MATDTFDNTAAGEWLVSHQATVTIEEVAGRKIARFAGEPFMEGHTTWKVSCNTLNLREKSAERFFHVVSITY